MGVRDRLVSQLGHPHGVLAPVIGRILNLSNAGQNRLAVQALHVEQHHRVLDIGFGGGVGLALLLAAAFQGRVTGVDISREMLQRAQDRHAGDIAAGRLVVQHGRAERLPFDDGSFDRVLSVNTYPFWTDPSAAFDEIRRVLTSEGLLALALVRPELLRIAGLREGVHRLEQPEQTARLAATAGLMTWPSSSTPTSSAPLYSLPPGDQGRRLTCVFAGEHGAQGQLSYKREVAGSTPAAPTDRR